VKTPVEIAIAAAQLFAMARGSRPSQVAPANDPDGAPGRDAGDGNRANTPRRRSKDGSTLQELPTNGDGDVPAMTTGAPSHVRAVHGCAPSFAHPRLSHCRTAL